MQLIDTHAHLYSEQFDTDRNEVVKRAIDSGVEKLFLPNIDEKSIESMLKLTKDFPNNCFAMMGLHPCSVLENVEHQLKHIESYFLSNNFIAVGEIGIDLYWDRTYFEQQKIAFKTQLEWAKKYKLPAIIHVRDSFDEVFEIVDEVNNEQLTGIFHCFTGTIEQAQKIINYGGFKLGIGGVVTFKNSHLPEIINQLDLSHLVLETDAPYLAPAPHRGKRNESSYIPIIAEKVAEIKQVSLKEIATITTQNALEIFQMNEK
jgi:TatD DNase family protein